jgi:quercetin dioxygenase-like cupin family protein
MDEIITDEPGHRVVIKIDLPELTLAEMLRPPGQQETPVHFHKAHSDGYYVLERTLTVTSDGERRELSTGDFALVAPGVVHSFVNASDAPVRLLNMHVPSGGFAEFYGPWAAAIASNPAQFDSYHV